MPPLLECEGPEFPSWGVACTDPAGRLYSRSWSARGQYSLESRLSRPVRGSPSVHNVSLLNFDWPKPSFRMNRL